MRKTQSIKQFLPSKLECHQLYRGTTRAIPAGAARCFEEASPEVRLPNGKPDPSQGYNGLKNEGKTRAFTLIPKR